jgi:hypothetical protein
MKRPTIKTAAEAAGIIAIVVSLILLAMEINQSNKIAIASIQYDILSDYNEYHRQVLADPELGAFVARLKIADDIALSPGDQARAHAFVTIFINIWFVIETAHDEGQLTDDTYQVYLEDARGTLVTYPKSVPYFLESIQSSPSLHRLEIFQPIFEASDALDH